MWGVYSSSIYNYTCSIRGHAYDILLEKKFILKLYVILHV